MDDALHESSVPVYDFDSRYPDAESNKVDLLDGVSSIGEINGNASEVLTRVDLDLACSSEKLVNLSVLVMHVATRESDFEAFVSAKEHMWVHSVEKALEFDLLSGILDSEVRELDKFMATLQADVINAHEIISPFKYLDETFMEMEEKLHDSEEKLKQSQNQVSEIKMQSAKFQRFLSCSDGDENWNDENGADFLEDDQFFNINAKMKMHTGEQQRYILRMLEKSLAREMDLEKKLTESGQIEEELKLRLISSEQEVSCLEEEAADVWERCFESDNASEILNGISKGLLGRLQILQFNLNGSVQREAELRSKLEGFIERSKSEESAIDRLESSSAELNDFFLVQTSSLKASLREAEDKLILADSEAFTLREKVSSLEKQLEESESQLLNAAADRSQEQTNDLFSEIGDIESVIADLRKKISEAESRAEKAEGKCKLLAEANMELNEELCLLKGSGCISEKTNLLEKQLREADIQLQHAVATAEASQEKQSMLYSAIEDMENLIKDLKLKVSKAESRADSAEEKCIILSESNAELNEELNFLRGRLQCLEASLHQAEVTKLTTAKDIGKRTKFIANLVMQLAMERERLSKQISSLAMDNKFLIVKLQQTNMDPSVVIDHDSGGNGKEFLFPKHDLTASTCTRGSKEEVTESSVSASKLDKTQKNISGGETQVGSADSIPELETVRRIDAGVLNFKHVFMAVLILLISAAAYLVQQQNCPFRSWFSFFF